MTTPRRFLIGFGLLIAGVMLLFQPGPAHAALASPHGGNGSGIPYWPGAGQVSNHYTSYESQHDTAISRWNTASDLRDFFAEWYSGGPSLTQYMVYSGSADDTSLANWFSAVTGTNVATCKWYTDNFSSANSVRAFMFGHTPMNNDKNYTVVCLNISTYGYSTTFDCSCITNETRIKGISHEMGHSIHLAHDSVGIMDTCWCEDISTADADVAEYIYASPP